MSSQSTRMVGRNPPVDSPPPPHLGSRSDMVPSPLTREVETAPKTLRSRICLAARGDGRLSAGLERRRCCSDALSTGPPSGPPALPNPYPHRTTCNSSKAKVYSRPRLLIADEPYLVWNQEFKLRMMKRAKLELVRWRVGSVAFALSVKDQALILRAQSLKSCCLSRLFEQNRPHHFVQCRLGAWHGTILAPIRKQIATKEDLGTVWPHFVEIAQSKFWSCLM